LASGTSDVEPLSNQVKEGKHEIYGGVRNSWAGDGSLGRWLPGFLQLKSHGRESVLVDIVENLAVRAHGNIVTMSFSIAENRLEELAKLKRAEEKGHGRFQQE